MPAPSPANSSSDESNHDQIFEVRRVGVRVGVGAGFGIGVAIRVGFGIGSAHAGTLAGE